MMRGHEDHRPRLLYELSALVFGFLRSPALQVPFSDTLLPPKLAAPSCPSEADGPRISAAGLASLLLGMSLALMLCGSLTFMIGFMLMPWVIGMVVVLYFVGLVWSLSLLGRSILCPASAPPMRPRKEFHGKHCISTRQTREEIYVWQ